jgi:SAM-dependent methyltransferase
VEIRDDASPAGREERAAASCAAPFRCRICGSGERSPALRKGALTLVRCDRCRLVQQDPLPEAAAYDARYLDAASYCAELLRERDLFLARDTRVLRELADRGARGRLLDVGAGAGILMEAARATGFEPVGLELARPSLARIREELRMEAHACPIESAPLPPASFGVVTFSHSLEHLRDPLGALEAAARLLEPGGFVHVAVPSWNAGKRIVAGKEIPWIFDEHISYFTPQTLREALVRAGFEAVECRSGPMECAIDWRFAVVVMERFGVDRLVRRFLRMGGRRLAELLTDDVRIDCPPWRFRLVLRVTRAFLAAWPERLLGACGLGEEVRATARRGAPA